MHRHTSPPLRRFGGHGLTDSRTHRLTRRTPSPATASLLAPKDPKRESQATTRAHLPTFGALEHRNRPLVSSPLRPSPQKLSKKHPSVVVGLRSLSARRPILEESPAYDVHEIIPRLDPPKSSLFA
ncbi:hypothetical protein DTO282F9_7472 [Paecilomyces variotii]|nr:hypothetical protein DTO282F9_7472 [Paecilomyces variotii]